MPRESAIVAKVRRSVAKHDPRAKLIKTSGEGEPDLIGSYGGRAVAIEVKQPGKEPTALQRRKLLEWAAAGAMVYWTDDGETFHLVSIGHVDDRVPS